MIGITTLFSGTDQVSVGALRKCTYRRGSKRIVASLALASLVYFVSPPTHAESIVNGNFETGTFTGWTNSGAVVVASDSAFRTFAGAVGSFPTGTYVAEFGGGDVPASGVLSQVFGTTAGQQYLLTFDYGRFQSPGCCAGAQIIKATAVNVSNDSLLNSITITDATGNNNLATIFAPHSMLFLASGPSTRLAFIDLSVFTVSTDGLLDNVSVTAVPEPATYLLFIVGLASVAYPRRRKAKG